MGLITVNDVEYGPITKGANKTTAPRRVSDVVANAAVDAICRLFNGGYLRIYGGQQPASPAVATRAIPLAELRFHTTAFKAPVGGEAVAYPITCDTAKSRNGTATWFRTFMADGTTALQDGSVGTSGSDINLNSAEIPENVQVSLNKFTVGMK